VLGPKQSIPVLKKARAEAGRFKQALGSELFAELIAREFGPRTPQHDDLHRA